MRLIIMGYMIWQVMCGNGAPTGMMNLIIKTQLIEIRKVLQIVGIEFYVGVLGVVMVTIYVVQNGDMLHLYRLMAMEVMAFVLLWTNKRSANNQYMRHQKAGKRIY